MGILEDSIGAVFGRGPGGNDGPSFGGTPYAPLATALIGMLAAKAMTGGFGNLGGMLGGGQQSAPQAPQNYGQASQPQGGGGLLGGLLGGGQQPAQQLPQGYGQGAEPQGGGGLLGGLGGLLHQFQQNGVGSVAQSWVGAGANQPATTGQLSQAVGPEMIQQLAQKTGLSEQQVLEQLSHQLPQLVDKLTPNGRLPTHQEASSFLNGGNPLNPG